MVASVGAIDGTVATCPSRPIAASPTTRPITAVAIGIPIATIVPNANERMSTAAVIPITSLRSVSGSESSLPIGPPTATSIPAATPGWAAWRTLSATSWVRSLPPTFITTGMYAVFPSCEICAWPCWPKGLVAL